LIAFLVGLASATPPQPGDPDLNPPESVQVTIVDDTQGRAALSIVNTGATALHTITLDGTVFIGPLSWSWTEDLPALDAAQSMEVSLTPPAGAIFDERQLGYASTVDMRVYTPRGRHAVMAYLWAPEGEAPELLSQAAVYEERDGRIPAHGPLDLPPDRRILAEPSIPVEGVEPGPEDTGLPNTEPVPGARAE
jgi:hypothetical protein